MAKPPRPFRVESADYEVQPNGCWIWTRTKPGPWGYGRVKCGRDGRAGSAQAHRVSYEQKYGPIPEGLVLDHLCRTPLCVNPDHLEPVTSGENVLRGFGPPALNARMTHCKRDHPLAGDNVRVTRDGRRVCRRCSAAIGKMKRDGLSLEDALAWAESREIRIYEACWRDRKAA